MATTSHLPLRWTADQQRGKSQELALKWRENAAEQLLWKNVRRFLYTLTCSIKCFHLQLVHDSIMLHQSIMVDPNLWANVADLEPT